uniref:C2H2-type domain-containing protein n=1 Tax=Denticeps clupeoides TaxID=299321 RepID=A0AAY4ATA6_9TELE
MAEGEADQERSTREAILALRNRFQELTAALKEGSASPPDVSSSFCQEFCQVLLEHGGRWKTEENPLPLLEMYSVAILSYAEATPSLSPECQQVPLVLDKLGLSCMDLLLSLTEPVPGALWEEFQSSVKTAHGILRENGSSQIHMLSVVAAESGVWTNATLCSILSNEMPDRERVNEFLALEGPTLLDMRIKHLIKKNQAEKAAVLAKTCSEFPGFGGKKNFKQTYLVCLCATNSQEELKQEIAEVDCKDALDMICNLESEGDEKGALALCSAFLKRQLVQGDVYCAWELTLLWSKLWMRFESAQAFLEECKQLMLLTGSVYHILLLIKVIQSEVENVGLPVCIEMCIQALKIGASDSEDSKATICKTISCLMPNDLEVKRACQLTEFLHKPTVDSYYAVESLFNEPDQKLEEESLPIPNSLRCDLLLALKMQWPFDPEFWDWKTLKRNCLKLMGDEASIVSSIDELNDGEDVEGQEDEMGSSQNFLHFLMSPASNLSEIEAERQKKREMKKLREQGFVSARFRNWRAYMQYCVLCDKEFLGHRIVKHALKHVQDGLFRCPICAKSFDTRAVLEPHVMLHVKQSSKERLAAMKSSKKSSKTLEAEINPLAFVKTSPVQRPIAITPNSSTAHSSSTQTVTLSPVKPKRVPGASENTEDCSCPVTSCQKVFKYFRNLVAHMKVHKNDDEARCFLETQCQKAVCQYCRRQFVNVTHLNDHLKMHCDLKPYYCIQLDCKARFHSHAELLMHRKVHTEFKSQCMFPNCGRIFTETYQLYDHEAQHYIMFTCEFADCGKMFYSQSQLLFHQKQHKQEMPYTSEPTQSVQVNELSDSACTVLSESASAKIKHSVESMLNSAIALSDGSDLTCSSAQHQARIPVHDVHVSQVDLPDSETTKASQSCLSPFKGPLPVTQPCSVKLEPISINSLEAVGCSKPMLQPQTVLDRKLFGSTSSSAEMPPKKETPDEPLQNNSLPSIEDKLTHVCPFQECSRRYCTSKSLSRHVKKVHPDDFEEWKLSRKYKRLVELSSKKLSTVQKTPILPTITKKVNDSGLGLVQKLAGIPQLDFPMDSTRGSHLVSEDSAPAGTLPFNTPYQPCTKPQANQNEVRTDINHMWHPQPGNNYNCHFSQPSNCPDQPLPDLQSLHSFPCGVDKPDAGLHAQSDSAHTTASAESSNTPHALNTDSSVMNQASKYISSSFMVLHSPESGQQCELPQAVTSEEPEMSQMGHPHPSVVAHNGNFSHPDALHCPTLHPYISADSSDVPVNSVSSLDTIDTAVTFDIVSFPEDADNVTHLASPTYKPHLETSSDHPHNSEMNSSVPYYSDSGEVSNSHELDQEETEISVEGKEISSQSDDPKKVKKIRSSKRTKWPAIIKDGKVICSRCYREFASTKSLGGHLSKRSQCKAFDEVDLTADLPTSFLDFLNDPNVSDMYQPMMSHNMTFKDEPGESAIYQATDAGIFEKANFTESYSSGYFQNGANDAPSTSMEQVAQHASQEPNESLSEMLDASQPHQQNAPELDMKTTDSNGNSANPEHVMQTREDSKISEIEKALQRLDLLDNVCKDASKDKSCTSVPDQKVNTETLKRTCNSVPERNVQKANEKICDLKPFRCEKEDCDYGAMTKEALFKHLFRKHNYSDDMINELKKTTDKFSPYSCQLCQRKFTRTTGLRIHYMNVHHLSREDITKIKKGRLNEINQKPASGNSVSAQSNRPPIVSRKEPVVASMNMKQMLVNIKQEHDINVPGQLAKGDSLQMNEASGALGALVVSADSLSKEQVVTSLLKAENKKENQGTTQGVNTQEALESKSHTPKIMSPVQKLQKSPGPRIDPGDSNELFKAYRPYCCVYPGCAAAFSIEQNLVLHYRAIHEMDGDGECRGGVSNDSVDGLVQEFSCQVENCSKVLPKVTGLLKHYLLVHKFSVDEASAMLSNLDFGTFPCDHAKCSASFTSPLIYLDHIKDHHKAIKISEGGDLASAKVDLTFKCEFEGCDRMYSTKSNLLRHLMAKHQSLFPTKSKPKSNGNELATTTKVNPKNGKENIANNKLKMKRKHTKKKEKALQHWTSFGKPSLKTLDEASAMCTKKFPLQYPCMIKGCDSVSSAERNIFKHYATHGLTERYIEDRRSQFIFCKKCPRSRTKDANKSDGVSTEDSDIEQTDLDEGGSVIPCPTEEPSVVPAVDNQQTDDENVQAAPVTVIVKRKRGRPRKSELAGKVPSQERMKSLRNRIEENVSHMMMATQSNPNKQQEVKMDDVALKTLDFQSSFIAFLEDSKNSVKRKASESGKTETPLKRQRTLQQKSSNIMGKTSNETNKTKSNELFVNFRNPLKIKSVKNVKIVMDKTFSNGADLLLKQLQDMCPIVILKKWLYKDVCIYEASFFFIN